MPETVRITQYNTPKESSKAAEIAVLFSDKEESARSKALLMIFRDRSFGITHVMHTSWMLMMK
jgi:hypothetical protein